jgi:hypothetical protein
MMEIRNNATGELICRQNPVYGGTGKIDLAKFDESGYILQPPCIWGDGPGLAPTAIMEKWPSPRFRSYPGTLPRTVLKQATRTKKR